MGLFGAQKVDPKKKVNEMSGILRRETRNIDRQIQTIQPGFEIVGSHGLCWPITIQHRVSYYTFYRKICLAGRGLVGQIGSKSAL